MSNNQTADWVGGALIIAAADESDNLTRARLSVKTDIILATSLANFKEPPCPSFTPDAICALI